MATPLGGIRVLEVANWLAAPAAGALMADLGAEVVKIEPPTGDPWRYFQLASVGYDYSFEANDAFQLDNRGKRSVTVDLEQPRGRELVMMLAKGADIFITNLVPGRRARYGLSEGEVLAANPQIIYASFSGYGTTGPDKDRLAFDYAAFWARSGIMGLVGEEGTAPPLQRGGMGDHATSFCILAAVLAALLLRQRTGRGTLVDCSLLNSGLWVLGTDVQAALVARQNPRRHDRRQPSNPIWNTYQCADGRWLLLVMPQPDRFWPRVCRALSREDLLEDLRFNTLEAQQANSRQLTAILDGLFAVQPRSHWAEALDREGCIWAPVQHLTDVLEDPQVRALAAIAEIEHPTRGRWATLNTPFRIDGADIGPRGPAPEVGQHTEEVLLELGMNWEQIGELRSSGVIG